MISAARDLETSLRALGWAPRPAGAPSERAADVRERTGVDPSALYRRAAQARYAPEPLPAGAGGGGVARVGAPPAGDPAPRLARAAAAGGVRDPSAARYRCHVSPDAAYDAFRHGTWLLEAREYRQAAVALERAKALEPDKGSIREALGRAYLSSRSYRRAAEEFAAAVELSPTDGYAHYGLARSLDRLGDPLAARHYRLAECFGTGLRIGRGVQRASAGPAGSASGPWPGPPADGARLRRGGRRKAAPTDASLDPYGAPGRGAELGALGHVEAGPDDALVGLVDHGAERPEQPVEGVGVEGRQRRVADEEDIAVGVDREAPVRAS